MRLSTCGPFHKHFMHVTYSLSQISWTASYSCNAVFQNALAYFAMALSYSCKMFIKLKPGCPTRPPTRRWRHKSYSAPRYL
jgi:hypothetical protein